MTESSRPTRTRTSLEVTGVSAWYGEARVLTDVSVSIGLGEVVTLVGRNGAGKTTLLRSIMGLHKQAQGSITFDGLERFAGISIRSDPGKELTLVSSLVALLGLILSLTIRRRRVFVRVAPGPDEGRTVVSIGGLAKDDDEGLGEQLEDVLTRLKERRA